MSDMSCRVAVLQLTCTSDKLRNREKCHELLCKAKNFGAQAAFLPEAFDFIGESAKQTAELAEELNEENGTVAFFSGITLFYYLVKEPIMYVFSMTFLSLKTFKRLYLVCN